MKLRRDTCIDEYWSHFKMLITKISKRKTFTNKWYNTLKDSYINFPIWVSNTKKTMNNAEKRKIHVQNCKSLKVQVYTDKDKEIIWKDKYMLKTPNYNKGNVFEEEQYGIFLQLIKLRRLKLKRSHLKNIK